jgi:hypothetical protein
MTTKTSTKHHPSAERPYRANIDGIDVEVSGYPDPLDEDGPIDIDNIYVSVGAWHGSADELVDDLEAEGVDLDDDTLADAEEPAEGLFAALCALDPDVLVLLDASGSDHYQAKKLPGPVIQVSRPRDDGGAGS